MRSASNQDSKTRPQSRPSATLYTLIVTTWLALMGTLYYGTAPLIAQAWRHNMAVGVMVASSILFIGYFWLSGLKDVFYTCFFHLWLKARLRLPELHFEWFTPPRVLLVYVTYNDFDEESLLISMGQDYPNFRTVILDDSTDPAYKARVAAFGAEHGIEVVRRPNNVGFKAGNINHYLHGRKDYDYFVLLDSDEKAPPRAIWRMLDYFVDDPQCGIVQASHRAERKHTPFTEMFARGVDSHWTTYQAVKDQCGFMSLLGHGAMVSRQCYEMVGGFPHTVAEDIDFAINARLAGFRTRFAPDVVCGEEFPLDYAAFTVRHNKWTQGNMEFIRKNTWKILFGRMTWFEKLDIILFTYSLPLTAVFSIYMVMNAILLPLLGYRFVYPLWMLAPTLVFLVAPMLNDIITFWRMKKGALVSYLFHSTLLFGSMYWVSLRASLKSMFGGSTFLRTPKDTTHVTFRETMRMNFSAILFAAMLAGTVILAAKSILPVILLTLPLMATPYLTTMNQKDGALLKDLQ